MYVDTNLQPNCSETAFKVYVDKLTQKKKDEVFAYLVKKLQNVATHGEGYNLREDKWIQRREGFFVDGISDKLEIHHIAELVREKFDMEEEDVETIRDDCYDDLMGRWGPSKIEKFAGGEYKKGSRSEE